MQHSPAFGSQIAAAYNVYVNPYGMKRLSPSFRPGPFDVLCARGKLAYEAEGNRRFRELVAQHQKSYSACTCKYQKSKIVSHIVNTVRTASPHGGFVKQIDGGWFEVGDRHAKEKVGQTFRDLLHTKYSSSTKAKARVRVQKRVESSKPKMNQKSMALATKRTSSKNFSGSDDDLRSSVSVVSDNASMDEGELQPHRNMKQEPPQLPPLKNAQVYGNHHPGNPGYKHRQRRQSQQERASGNSLMATLRSSIETFEHPRSSNIRSSANTHINLHRPMYVNVPINHSSGVTPSMAVSSSSADLEPLPLKEAPCVKVDFHDSHSTEKSFEEAMDDFAVEMGVPV